MLSALTHPFLFLFFSPPTPFCLANIMLHWNQPVCDPKLSGWTGCLRGQVCLSDRTCRSTFLHDYFERSLRPRDFSTDGRCGQDNNDLLCDPDSTTYFGTCCSKYGWCGDGDAYCGDGCVANCSESFTNIVSAFFNASQTTSRAAIGEPTINQSASTVTGVAVASASGDATTDGTCGVHLGSTVCGNWYKGSCCSMYGWCGNTTAHCGDGCQSGPCLNGGSVLPPGPSPAPQNANSGSFAVVGQSGVPVMHAALMENGRVVFLDKVEDYTQLKLPNGQYAYSAEYDPSTNQVAPLAYQTNAFCSGGAFLADGRLLNVGGNAPLQSVDPTIGDGFTALRYLTRSASDATFNGQDWSEPGNKLSSARWYASAQTLADGTVFVASGSLNGLNPSVAANNNPTFETLSVDGITNGLSIPMDILETNQPYYMYPFLHLLSDGSLFIFVAKSAELFNTTSQSTIRKFSDLPGDYRTYPNTGGSVLLPLSSANNWKPDIVICGGGAYQDISSPTDASCGRIRPLSADASWEMESMPEGRTMVEGTLLPDGTVVWLNGCSRGAQGFGLGAAPALEALIYDPSQPLGSRFSTGASSSIARMYHSVALLLLDGTIMVAGSNPVEQPILVPDEADPYVTEFRVEIYTPPYLSGGNADRRPTDIILSTTSLTTAQNNSTFTVSFTAPPNASTCTLVLHHGGFVTHGLHMGQRMLVLDSEGFVPGLQEEGGKQVVKVGMPPGANVAPPGAYVLFVVVDGVPGVGVFVRVL